jgi:hypothetical protein
MLKNMKNKQKEWHHATKPLEAYKSIFFKYNYSIQAPSKLLKIISPDYLMTNLLAMRIF